ncbi:MAG: protein kinase [Acidobacteria bacterium]|nr:protein kinase [Acidobacteriota bacterium]
MPTDRWEKVDELFGTALELADDERATFLASACAGDETLRAEVETLLLAHRQAGEFIQAPAFEVGVELLKQREQQAQRGRLIGAYQIIRELGQGGMGAVYLAARADQSYQKHVAIKLIRRGAESQEIERRFRNERQILAALDHPNIARLLDGGTTPEGQPYLVMEYIQGQPLDVYCAERKLDTTARLQLFRQVCAAVHYAHQHLVVHRDLKPSNILVTPDGTPKLLDFGIAKLLAPENGAHDAALPTITETAQGRQMLTPAYASPEQVQGGSITTATDVYALGVLLYELLTGHRPYQTQTDALPELFKAVVEQEPEPPSDAVLRVGRQTQANAKQTKPLTSAGTAQALRSKLRGDLDNIVLMALRKEPSRRYASVEQMSEDLRRYLEGRPVSARKATLGYRVNKFVRRNKAVTAVAALLLLSLLGGVIGINQQRRRAERRFNDVRKLARSVVFELHDAIEKLPGATPARSLLVQRSIEYLDSLALEAAGDASLQRELAEAYERIAGIQGNPYVANLGDGAGSLQSYRHALALREAVLQKNPTDVTTQLDVAQSLLSMSGAVEYAEGADAALRLSRRALQLCEAVAARQPQEPRLDKLLRSSNETIANALVAKGDYRQALVHFRQNLALLEKHCQPVQAGAENAACQRSRAMMLRKIGDAEWRTGDKTKGLELARQSLAHFETLAAADPNNAEARFALTAQHTALGNYLWEQNDLPKALQSYARALQLDEASVKADPENVQMRRSLITNANNVGYVLAQQGKAAEAKMKCDQSLTELENLLKANPTAPGLLNMAKEIYGYDGEVNVILAQRKGAAETERQRFWQAALKSYERSLALLHQLKEKGLVRAIDAQQEESLQSEIAKCRNHLKG